MTAKKKIIISVSVIVGILVVLSIISVVFSVVNSYDYVNKTYMFNTIEDLNFLNDKVVENNIKDSKIGNLSYSASKSVQIEFEGRKYSIYAYEFNSSDDVKAYGKATTGNNYQSKFGESGQRCAYYHKSFGFVVIPISQKLFVFKDNNVLYVEAKGMGNKQFSKFQEYLFTNLPQKVDII